MAAGLLAAIQSEEKGNQGPCTVHTKNVETCRHLLEMILFHLHAASLAVSSSQQKTRPPFGILPVFLQGKESSS